MRQSHSLLALVTLAALVVLGLWQGVASSSASGAPVVPGPPAAPRNPVPGPPASTGPPAAPRSPSTGPPAALRPPTALRGPLAVRAATVGLCVCSPDPAVSVEWLEAAADAGVGTVFLTAEAAAAAPEQGDLRGDTVRVVAAPGGALGTAETHCAEATAARCEWAGVLRANEQLTTAWDIMPLLQRASAGGATRVLLSAKVFSDPGGGDDVSVAERSQYRCGALEPAATAFFRLRREGLTVTLDPEELAVARYVPSSAAEVCDHGPRDLRRSARPRRPQLGVYEYAPNAQCRECCFNDLRLACGAAKPPQTEGGGKVVLITGLAGFIGMHTALELNRRGDTVVGVDNFNTYYDVHLKRARQARLAEAGITVLERDMCDRQAMACLLAEHGVTHVLNLAAQAGVRYSMQEPLAYTRNNVHCFVSVLESVVAENRARGGEQDKVKVVYASSSSVYGLNTQVPFSETDRVIDQASLYGSTKNANEHIARSYNHVYDVSVTGLRFFTVYGPMGRPDMAYFSFTERLLAGQPLTVYRNKDGSELLRDFTFVSDIVSGIVAAIDLGAHLEIFNLGNGSPQPVSALIEAVEEALAAEGADVTTEIQLKEMMAADVPVTYADVSHAKERLGYAPKVSVKEGVREFMRWYAREYNPAAFNTLAWIGNEIRVGRFAAADTCELPVPTLNAMARRTAEAARGCSLVTYTTFFYGAGTKPGSPADRVPLGPKEDVRCHLMLTGPESAAAMRQAWPDQKVWTLVELDTGPLHASSRDSRKLSRFAKLVPQLFFPDADFTLFLDYKMTLHVTASDLVQQELIDRKLGMAMVQHPCRLPGEMEKIGLCKPKEGDHGIWALTELDLAQRLQKSQYPEELQQQRDRYENMVLREGARFEDAADGAVIARNNRSPTATAISCRWLHEYLRPDSCDRDQPALMYVLEQLPAASRQGEDRFDYFTFRHWWLDKEKMSAGVK